MSLKKISELLGDQTDYLLNHKSTTIDASTIHHPGGDFVDRILPNEYRKGEHVHERGRIRINDEYIIPDDILKYDPYFEEFRIDDNKILPTPLFTVLSKY